MPVIVDPPVQPDSSVMQEIAESLTALLGAAGVVTFRIDELKRLSDADEFPDDYAELHLSTRGRGARRNDGTSDVIGYRAQVRVVSRYIDNADLLLDRVRALYGAQVTAGGKTSTPIDEGPSDPPADDDGWYSALTEWTFTL